MIDPGLQNRVALVTGGNNPCGIGAATAKALAAQGAAVFIHYFRQADTPVPDTPPARPVSVDRPTDPGRPGLPYFYAMQAKSAEEVVEAIRGSGGQADCWEADLADPLVIPELFDRAEERFGPVEVLVNNAADYQADTFLPSTLPATRAASEDADRVETEPENEARGMAGVEGKGAGGGDRELWDEGPVAATITPDSCDRHFAVNTRAVALLAAEYVRRYVHNEQRWGRIVNVSADWSWGSPYEISYRASKHALESYSRSAAAELGPLGITVNIVSPGPVQSGYMTPEVERQVAASIPLGRVGRPEDVADAVVFLASEQARWVTGQLLTVHGGHRMAPGL